MKRFLAAVPMLLIALIGGGFCFAQSLGDVARQERERSSEMKKPNATAPKGKHVYTNDDIPSSPAEPAQKTAAAEPAKESPKQTAKDVAEAKETVASTSRDLESSGAIIAELQKQLAKVQDDPAKVETLTTQLNSLKQNVTDWTNRRNEAQKVIDAVTKSTDKKDAGPTKEADAQSPAKSD